MWPEAAGGRAVCRAGMPSNRGQRRRQSQSQSQTKAGKTKKRARGCERQRESIGANSSSEERAREVRVSYLGSAPSSWPGLMLVLALVFPRCPSAFRVLANEVSGAGCRRGDERNEPGAWESREREGQGLRKVWSQ